MATSMKRVADIVKGDTLVDIDNAYVFEVESTDSRTMTLDGGSSPSGYPYVLPAGLVLLSVHDAEGEENYLILSAETLLSVSDDYR